jgi:hypothetical protein
MKLKITAEEEVPRKGYCSDAEEEEEEKEHSITTTATTTIRVPVLRLSPEFRKNFDEHTMKYTGKYGKELYNELVAVELVRKRYGRILMDTLHDNWEGKAFFKTFYHHKYNYCNSIINIHVELTY